MDNLMIEKVSLYEIMNGLNTGLLTYNDITKVRILTSQKPEYCIIPVEADISIDILNFIDSDKEKSKFNNKDIEIDTSVLDFIIILKDTTSEPGKYKITTMSVLELIVASSQLDSENKLFDLDAENFECFEIDYIEQESEIPTDMNIFG